MAQGKIKVKGKLPPKSKKGGGSKVSKNQGGCVRKGGAGKAAPMKKPSDQKLAKVKNEIKKAICNKIESDLCQKAKKMEEGRSFFCVQGKT